MGKETTHLGASSFHTPSISLASTAIKLALRETRSMPPDEVSIPEDTEITCAETSIPIDEFARLEDRGIFQDVSYNDEDDSIVGSVEINARTLAEFMYQYDTLEKVASHTRVRILRYIRDSEFKRHGTQGIAEELDIHPATASRHLNGLHRDGYLEKERDGEFIRDID